jgi:hypothetical protein
VPGPIETAFVDIVARLSFEQSSDLTEGIRREVTKAQHEFDRLEESASAAGQAISAKLSNIKVELNIRDAINSVNRLGNAVEAAVGDVRALSGTSVDLGTAKVRQDIDNLERSFQRLASGFKSVDGETLSIDVSTAETRINEVKVNVGKLLADLNAAAKKSIGLDVAPAVAALRLVNDRAT